MALLSKISNLFGNSNEKALEQLYPMVEQINLLEVSFEKRTDDELQKVTTEFKSRISTGIFTSLKTELIAIRLFGVPTRIRSTSVQSSGLGLTKTTVLVILENLRRVTVCFLTSNSDSSRRNAPSSNCVAEEN